jgi:hypothetical protein
MSYYVLEVVNVSQVAPKYIILLSKAYEYSSVPTIFFGISSSRGVDG